MKVISERSPDFIIYIGQSPPTFDSLVDICMHLQAVLGQVEEEADSAHDDSTVGVVEPVVQHVQHVVHLLFIGRRVLGQGLHHQTLGPLVELLQATQEGGGGGGGVVSRGRVVSKGRGGEVEGL